MKMVICDQVFFLWLSKKSTQESNLSYFTLRRFISPRNDPHFSTRPPRNDPRFARKKRTSKRNEIIICEFCRFLFFYKKYLFKGGWSLVKRFFKWNQCHACHTNFAVFFPLPSCCVSSLITKQEEKTTVLLQKRFILLSKILSFYKL